MSDRMEDVPPSSVPSDGFSISSVTPNDSNSSSHPSYSSTILSTASSSSSSPSPPSLSTSSSPNYFSSATPPTHPPSPSPIQIGGSSNSAVMINQQVTLLIEELRSQSLPTRLSAFRKIHIIAQALGVARTRSELIPYLGEFCDDDDEVLLILSSILGDMVDAVGGSDHAHVLLVPLEQLVASEETAVREKAVASIGKIADQVTEKVILESVVPLVERCAHADWFTSRISAASLITIVYPRVPSSAEQVQTSLRQLYGNLCTTEETPMVKRAAAANLGTFAGLVDTNIVLNEFQPLLSALSRDKSDSVRLLTVQSWIQMMKVYGGKDTNFASKSQQNRAMRSIIFQLAEDSSFRVRYMVADKFVEVCAAYLDTVKGVSTSTVASTSPSIGLLADEEFIACFLRFFREEEEQAVRVSAILKSGEFARLLGPERTVQHFFGPYDSPFTDLPLLPRTALASVILQFVPVLTQGTTGTASDATSPTATAASGTPTNGKSQNKVVIDRLFPMILSFLSDDQSEVRIQMISKLGEDGAISSLSGDSNRTPFTIQVLATTLVPSLQRLARDSKWRVRLQTIQLFPNIAAVFQKDLFQTNLFDTAISWLSDSVWSVREAAVANLVKLSQLFGREWCAERILPKVLQLAQMEYSYAYRLTAVFAMRDLAPLLGAQLLNAQVLPLLCNTMYRDPVPNVRFNVARLLGGLVRDNLIIDQESISTIEQTLNRMKEDADGDVIYCAHQALKEGFGKGQHQQQQQQQHQQNTPMNI